jgi:hypothetical protein
MPATIRPSVAKTPHILPTDKSQLDLIRKATANLTKLSERQFRTASSEEREKAVGHLVQAKKDLKIALGLAIDVNVADTHTEGVLKNSAWFEPDTFVRVGGVKALKTAHQRVDIGQRELKLLRKLLAATEKRIETFLRVTGDSEVRYESYLKDTFDAQK